MLIGAAAVLITDAILKYGSQDDAETNVAYETKTTFSESSRSVIARYQLLAVLECLLAFAVDFLEVSGDRTQACSQFLRLTDQLPLGTQKVFSSSCGTGLTNCLAMTRTLLSWLT